MSESSNQISSVELSWEMAHAEKPYRDAAQQYASVFGSLSVEQVRAIDEVANDASLNAASSYIDQLQNSVSKHRRAEKQEFAIAFSVNRDDLYSFADRTGRTKNAASRVYFALVREAIHNPDMQVVKGPNDPESSTVYTSVHFTKSFEDAKDDILSIRHIGKTGLQIIADHLAEQDQLTK